MALSPKTNKISCFLIRRRTLLLLVMPILALLLARYRPVPYALGIVLAATGQSLRFWAAGYITKDVQLAQAGPYAYTRNPLYLGSLLITLGWGAMSGRVALLLLLLAVFSLTHGLTIHSEERYLSERFGPIFEEYCRRVPRMLPRWLPAWDGESASEVTGSSCFSWQQALHHNLEGKSALGVGLLAVLYGTRLWW